MFPCMRFVARTGTFFERKNSATGTPARPRSFSRGNAMRRSSQRRDEMVTSSSASAPTGIDETGTCRSPFTFAG